MPFLRNSIEREGLGHEFLAELDVFYTILQRNPDTYSYYEKPVRQVVLKRFPCTVVYEVFDTTIAIYSVFMYRQNPGKKRSG